MRLIYLFLSVLLLLSCSTESTPVYTLTTTASPVGGGTITPNLGSFNEGETVSIQAIPSDGWLFSKWEQDLSTSANPINITMTKDYNIVGVFEQRMHPLTITVQGQGVVTETIVQSKTTDYAEGTLVKLEALPVQDWRFSHWEGDLSDSENPVEIIVDKPNTVLAVFFTFASVSTNQVESITGESAQSGGNVINDGGDSVTSRGVCWSTSQNPTTTDSCSSNGNGMGSFSSTLTGLFENTTYFVRAYASNAMGTSYGNQQSFTTMALNDVFSPATGRIWMDRNLGASRVAISSTDTQAYGYLFQWGRLADGHQIRNSSTTTTLSNSDTPGRVNFIISNSSAHWDWRNPQNNNLWQGVNGINNPCPDGYRLPTSAEWNAERRSWSSNNASGAFASPLKLPVTGSRSFENGLLFSVGSSGRYWTSSISDINATYLVFHSGRDALMFSNHRTHGISIRCIKD